MDRTVEILASRAAAIIENDYKEPVYGSSTYLLVMEDVPWLLDQLAQLQTANKAIPKDTSNEAVFTTCFGVPLTKIKEWAEAEREGRLLIDVREDVSTFARAMEAVLQKHDDRPGWENEAIGYLQNRLKEEWHELLRSQTVLDMKNELLDVTNFCMMIYCNLTRYCNQAREAAGARKGKPCVYCGTTCEDAENEALPVV